MKRSALILFFLCYGYLYTDAQTLATLEVDMKDNNGLSVPVKVDLDAITFLPDSVLQLVEVNGRSKAPVAYQLEYGNSRMLTWIIPGAAAGKHIYQLLKGTPYKNAVLVQIILH